MRPNDSVKLIESVDQFARTEIGPRADEIDKTNTFPRVQNIYLDDSFPQ